LGVSGCLGFGAPEPRKLSKVEIAMNTLENIENLVEYLTNKLKTLLDEREEMLDEITRLRVRLAERDKEAVKASQEMRTELETAQTNALRFEQEQFRIESKLQELNDKLIALVHVSSGKRADRD
jgi:predicted nuclease with TOPRIM domain